MILQLKIFIYNLIFIKFKLWRELHFNPLLRQQQKNPKSIPILIINFNQLFYLKQLVDFLVKREFQNIVIIDNQSTYPPLLEYYQNLSSPVKVERMQDNFGHMVFFERKELQKKYGQGFYVVTDADIVPNENLPEDFMEEMVRMLLKYRNTVTKVGLALSIDDIPETFPKKKEVLQWESKFWDNRTKEKVESYFAKIDTTFALYKPGYPFGNSTIDFLSAMRIAGDYTSKHGGWFINYKNLTAEQRYYQNTSSTVSSWLLDSDGNLNNEHASKYIL